MLALRVVILLAGGKFLLVLSLISGDCLVLTYSQTIIFGIEKIDTLILRI